MSAALNMLAPREAEVSDALLPCDLTEYFTLMMTSQYSGYISMGKNISGIKSWESACKTLAVPAGHVVMIEIKLKYIKSKADWYTFDLKVHPTTCQVLQSDRRLIVWSLKYKSGNVFLLHTSHISVTFKPGHCSTKTCFVLSFSFFPENKRPVKLASSLWNCSVEHYPSFHHHLACNMVTECEDGRDETADCPFSSPQCDGMIDLCDRCYTIAKGLNTFASDKKDVNKKAYDFCISLGGWLSIPLCFNTLSVEIVHITNTALINQPPIWTGLYSCDLSLPDMYTLSVVKEDKTVFHHSISECRKVSFKVNNHLYLLKTCLGFCEESECASTVDMAFCEFQQNKTGEILYQPETVTVNSSGFLLSREQQSMTKCPDGHVTHTVLLCGSNRYQICGQQSTSPCVFSDRLQDSHVSGLSGHHVHVVPTFTCNDHETELSYTLVCDFIADCPDESDESFCQHLPCIRQFRCASGQCVPFDEVCDIVSHCHDHSDEKNCSEFKLDRNEQLPILSPALVYFDGVRRFISIPMNSTESCPDNHYRCPGDFNDCLPVYTRCNSMYDCIDHQDEEGCEEITCSGFFRCRLSNTCVHSEHICDGWPHCPKKDDELLCNVTCPSSCLCQGHSFLCPQPFSAAHFPQLRYLDATGSGMTLSDVHTNVLLIGLVFAHCSINVIPKTSFLNLKILDLSGNILQHINMTSFLGLKTLQSLSLSNNPLTSLHTGSSSVLQHTALTTLDLSHTTLTVLDTTVMSLFPHLQTLNLTSTSIHTISPPGFQLTPLLTDLYMEKSPIDAFPPNMLQTLFHLRYVSSQNYKICCSQILPNAFNNLVCLAPKHEISSCEDLLQSWTYRGFLWLVASLSLIGNVFCCCARLFARSLASSSGFSVFVTNLTMADFLMGVYIAIIGVADEMFRGQYLYKDDTWKHSVVCKVAGFLSLLSSEVSALTIWLITLDRFIVLHFPFSTVRFGRMSAAVACLVTWLAGWVLAMVPLLPVTAHWGFYSQTDICIPLSVTGSEFKGRMYSFSVFIIFNSVLFLFVSVGQALIYMAIQHQALKTNSTKVSRDMTIARRLVTIAVTDFMCWFPIGLCGLLTLTGTPVPGEINVMLAIFVLPLNSALNPFMYTFNTLAEKRKKANETEVLKWLESHQDLISDKHST